MSYRAWAQFMYDTERKAAMTTKKLLVPPVDNFANGKMYRVTDAEHGQRDIPANMIWKALQLAVYALRRFGVPDYEFAEVYEIATGKPPVPKLRPQRRCAPCYRKNGEFVVKHGTYCHLCGGAEELT